MCIRDRYRREIEAEKNFFRYALFVSFFPQLVAGPIERSKNLLNQLRNPKSYHYGRMCDGLLLMIWGYFLKLVIADRIAIFVDNVYANVDIYDGRYLLLASVLFAFQIYCDFAGYSTIAIGAAEVMGFELMENFNSPYLSQSVAEFWRRWHISLGAWFKDYLLYPVSMSALCKKINKFTRKKWGNQVSRSLSVVIPASCVWIVTGVWHGAASCFVLWGIYHGILIVSSGLFEIPIQKLCKFLHMDTECFSFNLFRMARTFMLSTIGRIFFAVSAGFTTFFEFLKRMFNFRQFGLHTLLDESLYSYGLDQHNFTLAMLLVALVWGVSMLQEKFNKDGMTIRDVIAKQNILFRWLSLIHI